MVGVDVIPGGVLRPTPEVAGAMALFIEARLQTRSTFSAVEVLILVLALVHAYPVRPNPPQHLGLLPNHHN